MLTERGSGGAAFSSGVLNSVCNGQGIVCLIDLLNEFGFWLTFDSQNILALFSD
jgi:hypothetical protein